MRRIVSLALFLVLPIMPAEAASFDCAKASSVVEKTICGDPELSKADEQLADAYKAALGATLYPAAIRTTQQEWLAYRNTLSTLDPLRRTYRERTAALIDAADKWHAARRDIAADKARAICVISPDAQSDEQCLVDEFGTVAGAPLLRYQLQSYKDGDLRTEGGVVVLSASGDRLTPIVIIAVETAHFDTPRIVSPPDGRLLVLPGHLEGTGNFNAEAVFLFDDGTWREVDTSNWLGDLQKRLPKGWGAWKGVYPDYTKMTAETPLWQSGDANCCPTAGRASIRLRLQGQRLVIDSLVITRGAEAAGGDK